MQADRAKLVLDVLCSLAVADAAWLATGKVWAG